MRCSVMGGHVWVRAGDDAFGVDSTQPRMTRYAKVVEPTPGTGTSPQGFSAGGLSQPEGHLVVDAAQHDASRTA